MIWLEEDDLENFSDSENDILESIPLVVFVDEENIAKVVVDDPNTSISGGDESGKCKEISSPPFSLSILQKGIQTWEEPDEALG